MRWIEAGRLIMVTGLGCGLVACGLFSTEPAAVGGMTLLGPRAASVDTRALTEARHLFEEDNAGLALKSIETYLNANPDSASGHNLAGAIFDRIGRYDLAESPSEKALALEADYVPAINNFGLSKLQRARLNARLDLEQEAEALLARAVELSDDPERLAGTHQALRAALAAKQRTLQAAAPAPARVQRTVWLERRGENYTYVVTKASLASADAFALDLDPALALVSPGATMTTTYISIAPSRAKRLASWSTIPEAAPRLFGATSGLSVLSLRPQLRKPRWYRGFPSTIEVLPFPAETALTARAAALLKVASLP